jgi:hypothetical protein
VRITVRQRVTRPVEQLPSILLAIAAGMTLLACSRAQSAGALRVGEARAPLVRTDRDVYRATVTPTWVELRVVATLANRTSDMLFIHPCLQQPPFPPKVRLEKRVDDAWRPAWGGMCTHVLMPPQRLAPGQSRTDTVVFFASRVPNEYPSLPDGPLAGTYRLVYEWVYDSWDPWRRGELGTPVADSLLTSNEFRVVE